MLFCDATVRGSVADITQARQSGIVEWLEHTDRVEILTDAGYQGLVPQTYGQVMTPTSKHHKKALERMPGIAKCVLRNAKSTPNAEYGSNTASPT
jgi:hypothetical protein